MNDIQIVKKDVKHINIKVKSNGDVILTAPLKTTDKHISYVLKKRSNWISNKLEFYKNNPPPLAKEYVSGENCRYLGKNYRLKVTQSDSETVKLQRNYLNLFVKDKNNFSRKEMLIKKWYADKAKSHFQKALNKYQPIVNKDVDAVRIRQMKTRWGSCNPAKSYINLNSELIKTPTQCIEYVVLHELTHLIYPNHDKYFYKYLTIHMPNWKNIKHKLENNFRI